MSANKWLQGEVNKKLKKAAHVRSLAAVPRYALRQGRGGVSKVVERTDTAQRANTAATKITKSAMAMKKILPQGYAMVFGKLRKINPKAKRKGAALLKR